MTLSASCSLSVFYLSTMLVYQVHPIGNGIEFSCFMQVLEIAKLMKAYINAIVKERRLQTSR
jgi:hypothetical protein